jgi:hypothetical protein
VANPNLGKAVVEALDAIAVDRHRRDRDQVTTLHDWRKLRNGRWVDDGWMRPRPFGDRLLMWGSF